MQKNYPDYDDLVQKYQEGGITAVGFVTQQSDEMTADYEKYCKENKLDSSSNASAESFMSYQSDIFEESITN